MKKGAISRGIAGTVKTRNMIHSDELQYLNERHEFPLSVLAGNAKTQKLGIFAKLKARLRRLILGDYVYAQAEYQAHLVRLLNELCSAVDTKNWRFADHESASFHSLEKKLLDALELKTSELHLQVQASTREAQLQDARIKTLESVAAGLEQIVAKLGRPSFPTEDASVKEDASVETSLDSSNIDYSYLLLENRFRGSESEIASRLEEYATIFKGSEASVLEIGSGRGELQALFRNHGVSSYGVELDDAMVQHAQALGHDVRAEDGLAHLRSLPDRSLGGVVAIQVIEHLSREQLSNLLRLCLDKVEVGGKVVFETINTESMVALCRNYFRDPTHVAPLHPETMHYLMNLAGFDVLELRKLSPFGSKAMLQPISVESHMTPRWKAAVELLNHNFETLNSLLYGYQDYCIISAVTEK